MDLVRAMHSNANLRQIHNFAKHQKFLLVVDDLSAQGGTQTVAQELGKILSQQGKLVSYLSLKLPISEIRPNVSTLGIERNYEILLKYKKIRRVFRNSDLVLVLSGQIFQYVNLISRSKKIIYRESNDPVYRHSLQPFLKRNILRVLYRLFLMCRPNLIVQNKNVYEKLLKKSPKVNNLRILSNPCFANASLADAVDEKREFDLIYMSRHTLEKGCDRAEHIFSNSHLSGIVAGDNAFFACVENQENVKYVGRVDDLSVFYKSVKYLLLLSRVEGFPNCVHEAIQCGTRVMVSAELAWLQELGPEMASAVAVVNCENFEVMLRQVTDLVSEYPGPVTAEDRGRIRSEFDPYLYLEEVIRE